ncbi:hypothetical protein TNCV_2942121 [Trichonephila clavipes]|nr:hypothetical protein TNCV_2942121 [Trichonephila clavipes]
MDSYSPAEENARSVSLLVGVIVIKYEKLRISKEYGCVPSSLHSLVEKVVFLRGLRVCRWANQSGGLVQ